MSIQEDTTQQQKGTNLMHASTWMNESQMDYTAGQKPVFLNH